MTHAPIFIDDAEHTSRALSEGLVLLGCGAFGETIRLLYPLTISDQHFAEGFEMLEKALGQA